MKEFLPSVEITQQPEGGQGTILFVPQEAARLGQTAAQRLVVQLVIRGTVDILNDTFEFVSTMPVKVRERNPPDSPKNVQVYPKLIIPEAFATRSLTSTQLLMFPRCPVAIGETCPSRPRHKESSALCRTPETAFAALIATRMYSIYTAPGCRVESVSVSGTVPEGLHRLDHEGASKPENTPAGRRAIAELLHIASEVVSDPVLIREVMSWSGIDPRVAALQQQARTASDNILAGNDKVAPQRSVHGRKMAANKAPDFVILGPFAEGLNVKDGSDDAGLPASIPAGSPAAASAAAAALTAVQQASVSAASRGAGGPPLFPVPAGPAAHTTLSRLLEETKSGSLLRLGAGSTFGPSSAFSPATLGTVSAAAVAAAAAAAAASGRGSSTGAPGGPNPGAAAAGGLRRLWCRSR